MGIEVTFVPAPGWPQPPAGWIPQTDWQPPEHWPSAPPDWVFYRGAYGEPVTPPPGMWLSTSDIAAPGLSTQSELRLPPPPAPAMKQSADRLRVWGIALVLTGALIVLVSWGWLGSLQQEEWLHGLAEASQLTCDQLRGLGKDFGFVPDLTNCLTEAPGKARRAAMGAAVWLIAGGGLVTLTGAGFWIASRHR